MREVKSFDQAEIMSVKGSEQRGEYYGGRAILVLLGLAVCLLVAACAPGAGQAASLAAPTQFVAPTHTPAPRRTQSAQPGAPQGITPTVVPSPTPHTVFYEPAGCWQPPEDYTRAQVGGETLNVRTLAMLRQAAKLYDGKLDLAGKALLRGSYSENSLDSADVHRGGGVVDVAVAHPQSTTALVHEIEPLIRALRAVGFAAWLTTDSDTVTGPGLHIHAVAVGDRELSPAAQEQLTGPGGYFDGLGGLAGPGQTPAPDPYGGSLVCAWMVEAGHADPPVPTPAAPPAVAWQERLRLAAQAYIANYPEDAEIVARGLNFLDGKSESAENICGPLSGAILRDAGLLPPGPGPAHDLKSYWQARPSENGRPWSLFPARNYEVFRYDTPLARFDFGAWPLLPGDFVYTYAGGHGFEHMFVVTEVDSQGRAYTVTNQFQSWGHDIWGTMLIQRYLLYDPTTPGAGIIYNEWSDGRLGRTGHLGFEVLRKRGTQAGTPYTYTVRPGDRLPEIAARFQVGLESIAQANPELDLTRLQVGQQLTIPIPAYAGSPPDPGTPP